MHVLIRSKRFVAQCLAALLVVSAVSPRLGGNDRHRNTLTGEFDASVDILALQGTWRF